MFHIKLETCAKTYLHNNCIEEPVSYSNINTHLLALSDIKYKTKLKIMGAQRVKTHFIRMFHVKKIQHLTLYVLFFCESTIINK